jgi:hypothetical protein
LVDITILEVAAVTGSAVATAVLAFATYSLARSAKESLKEDRKQRWYQWYQSTALATQTDPLLKLHRSHFEGNTLVAEIENMGPGPAQLVGVETWFDPCRIRFRTKDGRPITQQEVAEMVKAGSNEKVKAKAWTIDSDPQLLYEGKGRAKTGHMVTCFQNPRMGEPFLNAGEKVELRNQPHFLVKPGDFRKSRLRRPKPERWFHTMDFQQTKKFLQYNGLQFVALGLRIICKKMMEEAIVGEAFDQFVMVVSQDSTLEDVEKRDFKHDLVTLGPREWGKTWIH